MSRNGREEKVYGAEWSADELRFILAVGADICERLKLANPHMSWKQIPPLFTEIKWKFRRQEDYKDEVSLIRKLRDLSDEELQA